MIIQAVNCLLDVNLGSVFRLYYVYSGCFGYTTIAVGLPNGYDTTYTVVANRQSARLHDCADVRSHPIKMHAALDARTRMYMCMRAFACA